MKGKSVRFLLSHKFRPIAWLGIIFISLAIAVVASRPASAPSITDVPLAPSEDSELSVTGVYMCLPHKDTSGPQTDECALGLLSGETYYSLSDTSSDYSLLSPLTTGDTITVTGSFSPSNDSKYKDIGTISVTKAEKQ